MTSRGGNRTLADASRGHNRTQSNDSQPRIIYDLFYSAPRDDRCSRKRAASSDDDDVVVLNNKRFRVTAGRPARPPVVNTAYTTGSPTAATSQHIPIVTTAAPAVVDQPINAAYGPDEVLYSHQVNEAVQPKVCTCCCCRGCWCCAYEHPASTNEPGDVSAGPYEAPYGTNVAGATTAAVNEYSSPNYESWDEEADRDGYDYPAMLPIPSTGPADYADRWELGWRPTRPGVFVLHSAAYIDEESDSASSDSALDDSDSDLDSDWTPPAVFPQPPDNTAHLQLGWTDVGKDYDYVGIAQMTVAAGRLARTEPLPEDVVRSPPEPTWPRERDDFLCPPSWDAEREAYIAAPLLGSPEGESDDERPIPYTPVRREIEEGGESVPWTNGCPWGQGGADDADGEEGGVAAEDDFYDSDSDDDYDDAYHEVVSHGLEVFLSE